MASQKLRNLSRRAWVTGLLPALLTFSVALNAQDSSETSKLPRALALAIGEVAKSSTNFNLMIAPTAATLAIASPATLPKFIAHRDYVAADVPQNLAKGDLNGDGVPDLVVPNFNARNVSVLLGKSDGSFQTVRLFDSGGVNPFDAVVRDFNGDGKKGCCGHDSFRRHFHSVG
jgi:hypothetical protein